eukprot:6531291-Alexandrium_andersonii.AAC.1
MQPRRPEGRCSHAAPRGDVTAPPRRAMQPHSPKGDAATPPRGAMQPHRPERGRVPESFWGVLESFGRALGRLWKTC